MTAADDNARPAAVLAGRQVAYQLVLLARSPLGTFTALVVPVMLLTALALVNPQDALKRQGYRRYADFLVPAMASFALLNACFINVATSVVTARETGVLKRLHSSPLPLWAYVAGRIGAAAVVGGLAFWLVLGIGVTFLDVRLSGVQVAHLMAVMALGALSFPTLAIALSVLVRTVDAALPVAYGSFLPVAFVSDVFFPLGKAPQGVRQAAAALPVSPISSSAERVLQHSGWPVHGADLLVLLGWTAVGLLVAALLFSWEPGGVGIPWSPFRRRRKAAS